MNWFAEMPLLGAPGGRDQWFTVVQRPGFEALPGGNGRTYDFSPDLRVRADNPAPKNGVDPGESLEIVLALSEMATFADVVAAFNSGDATSADLRIGLHVISFDSGGSESFIAVPEPTTALLMAGGLLGFAARRRALRR